MALKGVGLFGIGTVVVYSGLYWRWSGRFGDGRDGM